MGSFGNLRLLFERMDRVMQTQELSLVHHTGASASETLARQTVRCGALNRGNDRSPS
jgi:hypothetical protein